MRGSVFKVFIISIILLIVVSGLAFGLTIPSIVPTTNDVIKENISNDNTYEVGTIMSGINRCNQLTIDGDGNIYYINFHYNIENKMMGIINNEVRVIADGGISGGLDLVNIIYDKAGDRVLLLCNFNSKYYEYNAEFLGTSVIFDINDVTTPINIFQEGYFTFFSNPIIIENNIINNGLMFNLSNSTTTVYRGGFDSIYTQLIDNQYISYNGVFHKFNLSLGIEEEILIDFGDISLVNAISSYDNKLYLYSQDNRNFYEIDTMVNNAKANIFIKGDNLIIDDFIPIGNVDSFTFDSNGRIVFYDSIAKSIRSISIQNKN